MKAWPKGEDASLHKEGDSGKAKVIFDEECPSGSNKKKALTTRSCFLSS